MANITNTLRIGIASLAWTSCLAAPRLWTLQNVIMDDGASVRGSFLYDAATKTVSNWTITTSGGNQMTFPDLTYSPANSLAIFHLNGTFLFVGPTVPGKYFENNRSLTLLPSTPITDNAGSPVLIDVGAQISRECYNCNPSRRPVSGSLIPANNASFAHIASGESWKTIITLVNSGTARTSTTMNFMDDNGQPLAIPLFYPQLGGQPQTRSSVTHVLEPAAVLIIETGSANSSLVVGSAQLDPVSTVSGFAVFQQTGAASIQEAVVPLETRVGGSIVLPFDNTTGLVTGVAITNGVPIAGNVPVILRDDTGALLLNTSVFLTPRGHASFVLADRFGVTAQKRGSAEFAVPAGLTLSVLGLRFNPAGSFTSVPTIVK